MIKREIHSRIWLCPILLLFVAVWGCSNNEKTAKSDLPSEPELGEFQGTVETVESGIERVSLGKPEFHGRFTLLSAEKTGIQFEGKVPSEHPLARLYHSVFVGGGIAIGDVDGDGQQDIFFASGPGRNQLYRQTGNLEFENITESARLSTKGETWSVGVSFVDIDNDSDLDIYVCNYNSANELWLNNGKGVFKEVAEEFGVDVIDSSVMAYFGDFDCDGFQDMYLLTNRLYYEKGLVGQFQVRRTPEGLKIEKDLEPYFRLVNNNGKFSIQQKGRPDFLFHNESGKGFKDVTRESGIQGEGHGLSALWWDYDHDGDLDAYVCNDFNDPDCLYENDGQGNFRDVITEVFDHTSWYSMGSDVCDINNDTLSDLFTVDMAGSSHYMSKILMGDMSNQQTFLDTAEPRQLMRNFLHVNSGAISGTEGKRTQFMEWAKIGGVANTDWSWGPRFADFDSDGNSDLFVSNGHIRNFNDPDVFAKNKRISGRTYWDIFKNEEPMNLRNMVFQNRGGGSFQDMSSKWGLDHLGISQAAATGDLDGDGDLDLVVMNLNEPIGVYRNDTSSNNRVVVNLVGQASNRNGIGAQVNLVTDSGTQSRFVASQRGYLASNQPIAQFGLGEANEIAELIIHWPSGNVQSFENLPVNQKFTVIEPVAVTKEESLPEPGRAMFSEMSVADFVKHVESPFDDFKDQPLLPNKLSQLGPGIAVADLDNDNLDDFILSSGKGQTTEVSLTGSSASKVSLPDDQAREVMAPLLVDLDGDGDQDIYLVSGGVETNDPSLLEDRILINRGGLQFEPVKVSALVSTQFSGGSVSAADFDRDGDLDLFVGGRVVPGAYPSSPESCLLENITTEADKPKFQTSDSSKELENVGMVTSSLWSDFDQDGWIDLLVTTEWGSIRIFKNQEGRLSEVTKTTGVADLTGWWNGIAGGDFDNDGDTDYAITNFGLNTKYKATKKEPARIYFGTFDGSGTKRIIEAKVAKNEVLPVRGKSCSQDAMPFIREKFPTYHDFATSDLLDIYPVNELESAEVFEASELRSMILINDGKGGFTAQPMPWLVQTSPGFGIVATDFNGDGNADIFAAQNFYTAQRETGRMAGGLGALLLGNGDGTFREVWPNESGIAISGDAKGLSIADVNGDLRPDLVVGINDAPTRMFENQSQQDFLCLELRGKGMNPNAIGAAVTVEFKDGQTQIVEVGAGGSYLSQNTNKLFFGNRLAIEKIRVRWPDGSTSTSVLGSDNNYLDIRQDLLDSEKSLR